LEYTLASGVHNSKIELIGIGTLIGCLLKPTQSGRVVLRDVSAYMTPRLFSAQHFLVGCLSKPTQCGPRHRAV
jgi:hypothetical protein